MWRTKHILILCCILICFGSYAQNDDTTKVLKEIPILLKADKVLSITELRSSVPMYTLKKKKLEELGVNNVGDALKYIPGVQIKDYGGIGGIKTISFRSIGSTHTSLVLDGLIVPNSQTGSLNLSSFELFGVSKIQFSAGQPDVGSCSASAFINANVINVYSDLFVLNKAFRIQAYSNLTSISAFENGLLLTQPLFKGKGQIGFQGMLRNGNGDYQFIYPIIGNSDPIKRENAKLLNYRLKSTFLYSWKQAKISLSAYYYENEQELPGAVILYNPSNDQKIWNKDLRLTASHSYSIKSNWFFNFNAFYQSNYTRYFDPNFLNSQGEINSDYLQENVSGGFMVKRKFKNHSNYFFGTDVLYSDLEGNDLSSSPERNQLNSVIGFSAWVLNSQLHIESNLSSQVINDDFEQDDSIKTVQYNKLSPFISVSLLPFKEKLFRVRGFFKRAFRMPTFNDLYYNFVGNTSLKPEEANLFNVGLTYGKELKKARLEFTLDTYYNKVWNKIVAIPTKDLFNWSMQNIGIVDVKGIDISLLYSFSIKKLELTFNAGFNYNESKDITNPTSSSFKNQIPYTPFNSSTYGFSVKLKKWRLTNNLIYSGFRYSLNENIYANYLEAFTDWNIGLSKEFLLKDKHEMFINLKVMNLLNKNYEVIRSFPMPGRYYQLNLRYKLK